MQNAGGWIMDYINNGLILLDITFLNMYQSRLVTVEIPSHWIINRCSSHHTFTFALQL